MPDDNLTHSASLDAIRLAFYTPVREYPPLGDRKSVALLGMVGLMLTVLLLFTPTIRIILAGSRPLLAGLLLILISAFGVAALYASLQAWRALVLPVPPIPDGLAYFPHISAQTRAEYLAHARAATLNDALSDILCYNHALAQLSTRKFKLLGKSIRCLELLIPIWLAIVALISLFPDAR
jgi:hypothetical protein